MLSCVVLQFSIDVVLVVAHLHLMCVIGLQQQQGGQQLCLWESKSFCRLLAEMRSHLRRGNASCEIDVALCKRCDT